MAVRADLTAHKKNRIAPHSRLTLTIVLIVLLCVAALCILANIFIGASLERYAEEERATRNADIAENIAMLYYPVSDTWDVDAIHALGMYSMTDGYIIVVRDADGGMVWDAQNHDMTRCADIMESIAGRMERYGGRGGFESVEMPLVQSSANEDGGRQVGSVTVTSYGPFFMTEAGIVFRRTLNIVLIIAGLISLAIAFIVGRRLAAGIERDRMARKVLTADVAHELRTPVAAFGIQVEAMADGTLEPTPERLRDCHEGVVRVTELIETLDTLAREE